MRFWLGIFGGREAGRADIGRLNGRLMRERGGRCFIRAHSLPPQRWGGGPWVGRGPMQDWVGGPHARRVRGSAPAPNSFARGMTQRPSVNGLDAGNKSREPRRIPAHAVPVPDAPGLGAPSPSRGADAGCGVRLAERCLIGTNQRSGAGRDPAPGVVAQQEWLSSERADRSEDPSRHAQRPAAAAQATRQARVRRAWRAVLAAEYPRQRHAPVARRLRWLPGSPPAGPSCRV